jgi:hypothetical protein
MTRYIFGICGLKGAGKDTVGDAILAHLEACGRDAVKINFADPLKSMLGDVLGLTHDEMYGPALKEKSLTRWPFVTPRRAMQDVGMWFRDKYPGVWVKAWERVVAGCEADVVCTDYRFPDEGAALDGLDATLIRVEGSAGRGDGHASEQPDRLRADMAFFNDHGVFNAADFGRLVADDLVRQGFLPKAEYPGGPLVRERVFTVGERVRSREDGSVGVVVELPGFGMAVVDWEGLGRFAWPTIDMVPA